MNTFGELFRVTTFGESHGIGLGAVIDGCPAGVALSAEDVQRALNRRRPGQSHLTTPRNEGDAVEFLSGVYEGKTLGTPIATLVRNKDMRSAEYLQPKSERHGHADSIWREKFGHADPRGGGRTSGRETLSRVIGGAVAEALLARDAPGLSTIAWVSQVGALRAPEPPAGLTRADVDAHATRCPDAAASAAMDELITKAKGEHDSWGGTIGVRARGVPPGLGEPVFGKLKARMAGAIASIGAVCGVILGPRDLNERLTWPGTKFHTAGDDASYGGIQGGLSTGADVELTVLVKPPATLGERAKQGRHDPCILPRVVPVVEAMVSLVLADAWLIARARHHRP